MLRFFRQIRQRSLTDNKFSKYLLYAIGEILLVVIGILIALQIDSWNEGRKNNTLTKIYLNQLLNDFDENQEFIRELSSHYDSLLNNYNNYLKKIERPEISVDSSLFYISRLESVSRDLTFQFTTIKTLETTGDIKLMPTEIRTKLVELKSLQERTIKGYDYSRELYGIGANYASRLYGGGGAVSMNLRNIELGKKLEKSKPDILLIMQSAQDQKIIGEEKTLKYLREIKTDMDELTELINAELKK